MNRPSHARALLVFAREPVAGRVKTRLIPAIGPTAATAVYRYLLTHTLQAASQAAVEHRDLWLDHVATPSPLAGLARSAGFRISCQSGADLGARMDHAMRQASAYAGATVLIGSDCPDYSVTYLDAAFAALQRDDAVIGPASDGGYVLIGLRRPQPALFVDVAWGTDRVLATTRDRLRQLGLRWQELAPLDDVDRPEDLRRHPRLMDIAADADRVVTPPAAGDAQVKFPT